MQKRNTTFILVLLVIGCLWPLRFAQAVVPPPDGDYPGGNTAEGQSALLHLASGTYNTAVGWASLGYNIAGNFNTAVGAGSLLNNTSQENTATGAGALLSNSAGSDNTANGAFALLNNTTGSHNTATGVQALLYNTTGNENTANGLNALAFNTEGSWNTATGVAALYGNTIGEWNTANGVSALISNTTGSFNTAIGANALQNNTRNGNTAIGYFGLYSNTTGEGNTALGNGAGSLITTGNYNIDIGNRGFDYDTDTIRIGDYQTSTFLAGIFGQTSSDGIPVLINEDHKLGTTTSSKRFKEQIKAIDEASEPLFSLKPVTFRYNKEVDPTGRSQFGLVAEDVEKVNPHLVVRDKGGKPYSVRYDQVNVMLLNEFLKAHRKIEKQEATIARQQKQIEALTAGLQRVSAQIEKTKTTPTLVLNNP